MRHGLQVGVVRPWAQYGLPLEERTLAQALKEAGAIGVIVAATHAVFSDPAVELLQSEFIDEVVVTDTLPLPPEKRFPSLTVLPIAPLLARAIYEVFDDGSVTSMFDGAA